MSIRGRRRENESWRQEGNAMIREAGQSAEREAVRREDVRQRTERERVSI